MTMRDSGILKLYKLTNIAEPGNMPVDKLVLVDSAYYSEMQVGVTRLYMAMGINQRIDKLVRCWNTPEIDPDVQYAILEDGQQYMIQAKQAQVDTDAYDLTLVRMGKTYDVAE